MYYGRLPWKPDSITKTGGCDHPASARRGANTGDLRFKVSQIGNAFLCPRIVYKMEGHGCYLNLGAGMWV